MIDNLLAQRISALYEQKIAGIFKKYGHSVQKLDKDKTGRRPDYLVQNRSNNKAIFECKYIVSAGMTKDGKYHISTLDPELPNYGVFEPNSLQKYRNVLYDARQQYLQLIQADSKYANYPFIVAIGSDFFAEGLYFVPKNLFEFVEISAIIKIEKDIEQKESLKKYTLEELERIINGNLKISLPPPSVRFKVLLNSSPNVKFDPNAFLRNPIIT